MTEDPDVENCDEHTASIREIMVGVLRSDLTPKVDCLSENFDCVRLARHADSDFKVPRKRGKRQIPSSELLFVKRPLNAN